MPRSVYVQRLQELQDACSQYKAGEASLQDVQHRVYETEHEILLREEAPLRALLNKTENDLELIQFTLSDTNISSAALAIIEQLQRELVSWM